MIKDCVIFFGPSQEFVREKSRMKLNPIKVVKSFRSDWWEDAVFSRLICGGSPGSAPKEQENSGGGKFPSQISRRKNQAGSLGTEEKISSPFSNIHPQS